MQEKEKTSRRNFLKKSSLAGVGLLTIPQLVSTAFAEETRSKKITISKDDVILFQGDSITDAGRKRDKTNPNQASALGSGYAMIAASALLYDYAGKNLKVYNRGVSGNKVYQLADRWDKDTFNLKPNVLSILVGVNDFWHTLVNGYKGTIKTYRDDYKTLLDRTKQTLPDVKLIIGEPYAVIGVKSVDEKWYPAFDEYRKAAREIAASYDAIFIPYQSIYDKAQKVAPGAYWTADGVHPTLAGARLMAHAWMQAVKG
ncbi:MAG TPA: GDSL-type esterase/lipase family protein [Hanamia sp.]|nr:GDSL-type esterase/lipase family protein [Hanamia sp.]